MKFRDSLTIFWIGWRPSKALLRIFNLILDLFKIPEADIIKLISFSGGDLYSSEGEGVRHFDGII